MTSPGDGQWPEHVDVDPRFVRIDRPAQPVVGHISAGRIEAGHLAAQLRAGARRAAQQHPEPYPINPREGTSMTNYDGDAVDSISRLAREGIEESTLRDALPDRASSILVERHDARDKLTTIDLERFLDEPRRQRGDTVHHDAQSFTDYVLRVAGERTTVWCDESTRSVRAVLNDHGTTADPAKPDSDSRVGDVAAQGWRDHTITLALQRDPEWEAWLNHDGKWLAQGKMADHLEDYRDNIVEPRAAVMFDVARKLRATRTATIDTSPTVRSTGDFQVSYRQETKTGGIGEFEVPELFKISVSPYLGDDPVQLDARFRLDIDEQNRLVLGYQIVRADLVKREAFRAIRDKIAAALDSRVPVFLGKAPDPLRAVNRGDEA